MCRMGKVYLIVQGQRTGRCVGPALAFGLGSRGGRPRPTSMPHSSERRGGTTRRAQGAGVSSAMTSGQADFLRRAPPSRLSPIARASRLRDEMTRAKVRGATRERSRASLGLEGRMNGRVRAVFVSAMVCAASWMGGCAPPEHDNQRADTTSSSGPSSGATGGGTGASGTGGQPGSSSGGQGGEMGSGGQSGVSSSSTSGMGSASSSSASGMGSASSSSASGTSGAGGGPTPGELLDPCMKAADCSDGMVCLEVAPEAKPYCSLACTADDQCSQVDWGFCIEGYCMRFCGEPGWGPPCSPGLVCHILTDSHAGACVPQ